MKTNIHYIINNIIIIILLSGINLYSSNLAFYYWGTGIQSQKFNKLIHSDTDEIFIKAGSIYRIKNGYKFKPIKIPSGYKAGNLHKTFHLVFPFVFNKTDRDQLDRFIEILQDAVDQSLLNFKKINIPVAGIQFDMEGELEIKDYITILDRLKIHKKKYQISGAFYPQYIRESFIFSSMDSLSSSICQ